jgi:hypothetical protein
MARSRRGWARGSSARLLAVLAAACAVLAGASPAQAASIQHEFAAFSDCPIASLGPSGVCIISTVTSGEFVIGSKAVPINKTVTLQGGVENGVLVPAADGNTLSKTPLQLPGGLAGIELLPPLTEVTATAELAGTGGVNLTNSLTGKGTAVSLPVVVKLDNSVLGNSCFIGTPGEPIALNLTTGTTSPPGPNHPISGSPGTLNAGSGAPGITADLGVSLVDNSFSAPGVNGCGLLPLVIDPLVDIDAGLPAAAGHNTAIMNGSVLLTEPSLVKHWATLPELGRCSKASFTIVEKQKVFHGGFRDAGCVFEESPNALFGEYEWQEGPGAGSKFAVADGATTFETKSGAKLTCTKATGSGEYAGTKSSTMTLNFGGCKYSQGNLKCHSAGAAAGEIRTSTLAGTLGFVEDRDVEGNLQLSAGIAVAGQPTLFTAECGTQAVSVAGSAIGVLTPIDLSSKSFVLQFSQAGGTQQPAAFEEASPQTLSLSFAGGSPETAGLSAKVKLNNAEKLDVKVKP